jgi:3-oxoadipate enol-lactonase
LTARPILGSIGFAVTDSTRPLLVLGPSLGASVTALWQDVVPALTPRLDVLGWDLPGHGVSPTPDPDDLAGLTVTDLAEAVLDAVAVAQAERGDVGAPFVYAGVSAGGAVGQQLLVDHADRVTGAALLGTATRIGTPPGWHERADLVQAAGTPTQITGSAERWFAPGFLTRRPDVATRLLASLQVADRFGYAAVCRALAAFDLTGRLGHVAVPVLSIAGAHDLPTPPQQQEELVADIPGARFVVLDGAAHLAPAEQPAQVARLLGELLDQVEAAR